MCPSVQQGRRISAVSRYNNSYSVTCHALSQSFELLAWSLHEITDLSLMTCLWHSGFSIGCAAGWVSSGQNCYKFVTSGKKWDAARADCIKMSSDLVSITSAQEQAFVASQAAKFGNTRFWIGLNDKRVEGKFEWSDSSSVIYKNWYRGEPNNAGGVEDCAEINGRRPQWNDLPCTHNSGYICKQKRGK